MRQSHSRGLPEQIRAKLVAGSVLRTILKNTVDACQRLHIGMMEFPFILISQF
jgi:hypothetical protein